MSAKSRRYVTQYLFSALLVKPQRGDFSLSGKKLAFRVFRSSHSASLPGGGAKNTFSDVSKRVPFIKMMMIHFEFEMCDKPQCGGAELNRVFIAAIDFECSKECVNGVRLSCQSGARLLSRHHSPALANVLK